MKKLLAFLLLFPLCLTACAPSAEDYLLFTPSPPEGDTVAKTSDSPTPTPAETPGGDVLRVLVADGDTNAFNDSPAFFTALEAYRKREGLSLIALDLMTVQYPGVVNEGYTTPAAASYYLDTLTLKLLSGDDSFDMFLISGNTYANARAQFNGFLRKEYFVSMEKLGLAAMFDGMLPGVKDLCSADEEILLAPFGFILSSHAVRLDSLAKLRTRAGDIPNTAAAFTDYILDRREDMADANLALTALPDAAYFMSWFSEQYVIEYMTHGNNTQAMWDALVDMLERLFTSGLCDFTYGEEVPGGASIPYDNPVPGYTDTLFFDSYIGINGGSNTGIEAWNVSLLPYLLLTEDARVPINSGAYLAVNPHSKNRALVQDYLASFLDKDFRRGLPAIQSSSECKLIYDDANLHGDPASIWYKNALPQSARGYSGAWWNTPPGDRVLRYVDYAAYRDGILTSAEWKAKVDRELEFLRDE